MNTPLYSGNGAGVKAHSMRRRKMTPPIQRQRSFSPARTESIVSPGRRKMTPPVRRQRSFSPGGEDSLPSPHEIYKKLSPSINSPTIVNSSQKQLSNSLEKEFPSRKISSSISLKSRRHLRPCTTNRRLELAIDQFTSTALPFYLEVLAQHTSKILKVS